MVFVVAAIVYFSYKRSVKETKQFVDNLVKAHCDFLLTVANTNLLHDDRAVFFRISTSYNFAALHDPGISKENIISIQKKILLDMSQSQDKMSCIAFFELLLRVATAIYPTAKNESKLDMLNLMCLYITCIHAIQTDLSTHMTDFVNFYNLFILGQPDVTINMLVMSLAGEKSLNFFVSNLIFTIV